MKRTAIIVVALLVALVGFQQEALAKRYKGYSREQSERRENLRDRRDTREDVIDTRHDGEKPDRMEDQRDKKEDVKAFQSKKKELKTGFRAERKALIEEYQAARKALKERSDTNGDGKLSQEERAAAKEELAALKNSYKGKFSQIKDEAREEMKDFKESHREDK